MKKKRNAEEWVNETINSLNSVEKQDSPPFLLTRLHARIKVSEDPGLFGKLVLLFSRPAIVLGILLLIIAVNGFIIASNLKERKSNAVSGSNHYREDFTSTLVSVYDYENAEP